MSKSAPALPCSKSHIRGAVLRYEIAEIRSRLMGTVFDSNKQMCAVTLTHPHAVCRVRDHGGGGVGGRLRAAAVFRASLTELEATGILASSAQSLATGKSMELAREEMARATAAGVEIVTVDDSLYPQQLKQIYDPPLVLYVSGQVGVMS